MYTQWWYTPPPDWSLFLTVPAFAVALALWFKQDWKSRDMLVSTGVASTGFLVNYWVKPVSRVNDALHLSLGSLTACFQFTLFILAATSGT